MPRDLERGVNALRDRPRSGASQPNLDEFDFRDSSGPLFSMYLKIGEEEDKKTAERWQGDAKGILYFTGLFSAAVATLLSVTVLDLKPNSQDTSAFHLNNIQQLLTDPNISRASIPSQPPPFSPPISAIWVNALLFLSLVISLTCALLATLLQQWARRYVGFTQQPGYSPHKRARIRAFFSDGVDKFHVSWVVEALPALLHLSLSLFLAGLLVWLFNLNGSLFLAVVWMVALSAVAYGWITFLPIFHHNSPYYAPLSSTFWFLYTGIPYGIFNVLSSPVFRTGIRFDGLKKYYGDRLSDGIGKTAEKTAWVMASEIDVRILESTLDALGQDGARAGFFEAIPGFFDSNQVQVKDLEEYLLQDFRTKFSRELHGFLDRTFSSNLVSESTRSFQLIICLNAIHAVLGSDGVSQVLYHILNERWRELLQSVEVAHSLRRWSNNTDEQFAPFVQRIVTQVIAGVQERDDRWISLTKAEFDVPDHVLRDNIRHGDSALLSLLIYMTRKANESGSWMPWILSSLCGFDIHNTVPELQHEFCTLWNELVQKARRIQGRADTTAIDILREIRHAYLGLHQGTEASPTAFSTRTYHFDPVLAEPLSYRLCKIPSHHPDWNPHPLITDHLIVPTPTRAAFGSSAASTTQVGDSPSPSPRLTPIEVQRIPGNADIVIISSSANIIHTAPQQAEEAIIVPRFPSSTDLAMKHSDSTPHTNAFRTSTTGPMYITQRVFPVTGSSVPESIGTVKANESSRDLHPLASMGLSHYASQSALSVTGANHVRPEGTMADPYSRGTEDFRASVAASPLHPHLDPHPTVVDLSTSPIPRHSFSVPDSGGVLDASHTHSLAATSARPLEGDQHASTASPISRSIPSSSATLQRGEEMIVVPTIVVPVSDSQTSPIPMPAHHRGVIPTELPSSTGSTCIQSDYIAQPLGSPSSTLSTTRSHISPQSSVSEFPVTPSSGVFLARSGTPESEPQIPSISLKIFSDLDHSAPPSLDLVAGTSPPSNYSNGLIT